jgi:hypothetical protein
VRRPSCKICRLAFDRKEFGSPTMCLECVAACANMSAVHTADWREQAEYTAEREARIRLYERRAALSLPLFDSPALEECA